MYEPTIQVDEQCEATPNSFRGTTAIGYRKTIEACLQECHRTLKRNGRLILTFHNTKLAAWHSLGSALKTAGFSIRSLAVIGAENRNDLCKRHVKAMLADLVVECAPTSASSTPYLAFRPKTVLERNLAAMGLAIARCTPTESVASLKDRYRQILARNYECKPMIG
jgi:adenine-specific DNA methylase